MGNQLSRACTTIAEPRASELAHLTAAFLAGDGHPVSGPDPADLDGCRLTVAGDDARYSLSVSDNARVDLQRERHPDSDDPHRVAAIAAALLSDAPGDHPGTADYRGLTFKGIVGRDLKARGLDVALHAYTDEETYDVCGEIAATAPGGSGGTVYVTDDAWMTWTCDLWPDHAAIEWEPQYRSWLPDPAATARAIADAVSRALSIHRDLPSPISEAEATSRRSRP